MGLILTLLAALGAVFVMLAVIAWRRPRLGLPPLALAAGLTAWGFWFEPRSLVVTRLTLPVEGLAAPVRAAVIGDIQPSALHWPIERIEAAIARAAAEEPDIVLWLGDYAYDGSLTRIWPSLFVDPARTVAAMERLDAPMGAWAVLGNHDWWWDGPRMIELLADTEIRLLMDETGTAEHPETGARLRIAGLDDLSSGRTTDPEAVLANRVDAPTVVLSHSPDAFPLLPDGFALALAGHSHCGQVWLPLIGRPILPIRETRFACGLVEEGGRRHFVTSGIGTAIVPVRFLAPPEVVILELVPG